MTRTITAVLMIVAWCLATDLTSAPQGQASGPPQSAGPDSRTTLTRTPDGDYLVTYFEGAEQRSYTYVPSTKVEPTILSSVTRDSRTGNYTYAYRFINGRAAKQALAVVDMFVPRGTSATGEAPQGWRFMNPPVGDRWLWMREFQATRIDGLAPGSEARGFRIVTNAEFLPGPENAGCRGNILALSPPPDELPQVFERLHSAGALQSFKSVPAIVPSIPTATSGDVTAQEFELRFLASYDFFLGRSRHPAQASILAALREAFQTLPNDTRAAGQALDRARTLAPAAGQDEWAQSLGQALALCIDFMKAKYRL